MTTAEHVADAAVYLDTLLKQGKAVEARGDMTMVARDAFERTKADAIQRLCKAAAEWAEERDEAQRRIDEYGLGEILVDDMVQTVDAIFYAITKRHPDPQFEDQLISYISVRIVERVFRKVSMSRIDNVVAKQVRRVVHRVSDDVCKHIEKNAGQHYMERMLRKAKEGR